MNEEYKNLFFEILIYLNLLNGQEALKELKKNYLKVFTWKCLCLSKVSNLTAEGVLIVKYCVQSDLNSLSNNIL